MKKILVLLLFCFIISHAADFSNDSEKTKIINLVKKAYIGGVFNDSTTDAMDAGFHPDFTLQMPPGSKQKVMTLADWKPGLDNWKKNRKDWNNRAEGDIKVIGISGNAAVIEVNVKIDNKLVYTDFMSLYKFEDGWKITNKIYYEHK